MKNKNDITEIEMRDVKVPVFKIGDVVWAIAQDTEEIKGNCGFCGGTGKAIGDDKNEIECPICEGKGQLIQDVEFRWKIVSKFKVEKSVVTTENKDGKIDSVITYYHADMCFNENQCFRTEMEAQFTCDTLNVDIMPDID